MSATATTRLESYTLNSWRRGAALYLEHPFVHGARWFRYMARRCWPGRALRFTDGQGNRYLSMKNNFTSFAVAVLGERDPNVMRFLRRCFRPGFVACDVGANIGTYTVPLARLAGPNGHVIAFEPNWSTYACLRQNIRQNRLPNVTLLRAAAGPEAGVAGLIVTADNFGEVHLAPPGGQETARVAVTTVDEEVARLGLRRVDYIKIDVEGFELAALRGAAQTLAANPRLIVQTEIVPTHAARYGFGVEDLVVFFAAHGFAPYTCDETGHFSPVVHTSDPSVEADWFWARSAAVFESEARFPSQDLGQP